jgi:hypothetical protein
MEEAAEPAAREDWRATGEVQEAPAASAAPEVACRTKRKHFCEYTTAQTIRCKVECLRLLTEAKAAGSE